MATNLEYIKSASGTDITQFNITDIFSSKYDVYHINIYQEDLETECLRWGKNKLCEALRHMLIIREFETMLDAFLNELFKWMWTDVISDASRSRRAADI